VILVDLDTIAHLVIRNPWIDMPRGAGADDARHPTFPAAVALPWPSPPRGECQSRSSSLLGSHPVQDRRTREIDQGA
jgi:hypothetical protein